MTRLTDIRADRLDDAVAEILPIFAKACRLMEGHSQPLEQLNVSPSLEDLKADWAKLQAARDTYQD